MPNGLVLTMAEIADTSIAQNINGQIGQSIENLWKKEKVYIDRKSMVINENFDFFPNFSCYYHCNFVFLVIVYVKNY